jgi:hypothetical protein
VLAGLLLLLPAMTQALTGAALPAPHWLALALLAALLGWQWRKARLASTLG